jgi:archaeal type IV pilus assembly protein PilA
MNYNKIIRKLKRNSKALSPVVASIILIAVTVAVSVVVAAWMGGMTIGLMGSAEQVSITNIAFTGTTEIDVMVQNSGGTDAQISSAFINGATANFGTAITLQKSSTTMLRFQNGENGTIALTSGTSYTIKLITAKGTSVVSSPTIYST